MQNSQLTSTVCRTLVALLLCSTYVFFTGCGEPSESPETVMPTSGIEDATETDEPVQSEGESADAGEDQAAKGEAEVIRFVADKRLSVPGMMCPYSCWPTVKETLAKQPGVEGIQLAEQPEGTPEGEIKERVVELKLSDDFDPQAAIAALKAASFEAEVMNN